MARRASTTESSASPVQETTMRLCLALLILAGCTPAADVPPPTRPNVILVLIDDQGYGDLSCLGNPVLRTPHIDRLHSESVRFTDFHVSPMCTPSRGQILSGRDALANGAMNVSSGRALLRRGIPTMADAFAAAGYRTGQFGKWHLGDNYPFRPNDRGFQESIFFPSSTITSAAAFWNNDYFDDTYVHNGKPEKYTGYCTDVFFGEAMTWMKGCAERREPFFTYLPTNAPHGPTYCPAKYRELYKDQPRNLSGFFGMIANLDDNMERLDRFLAEQGLRENTIVLFMTDNGGTAGVPVYNAGMRGKKVDLYEGGHRVPCFLRWPAGGLGAPRDVAELAESQDLFPTLIDLCGLGVPKGAAFDGVSLAGLLRGRVDRLPDRMLVVQFSRLEAPRPAKGDAAVLWQRWRLVGDKELYDLRSDFAQTKDVAAEHPEVVARMRAHYEAWWSRIEPRVNELERITVGSDRENPTTLSPCDWQDVFLDQAGQVRAGEAKNGAWGLIVDRTGEYEISLRRWPVEADAAIADGVPPFKAVDGQFPAGKALPIVKARLKAGAFEDSREVAGGVKVVTFRTPLQAGPVELRTAFLDADGKELCGAYYVSVRRR
jgi:arylsulfatase